MKLLSLLSLSVMVWLTGCANIAPKADVSPASTTPDAGLATAKPAAGTSARTAIYPRASLQPITAAEASSRGVAQLKPPADLWERIRRGFAMPNLESDLVVDREQWYTTRPDYIQRMTERSSKYLFYVVEELERRGMPTELALLPYIESAFNPQAVSSAKAAGMWQFMPSTGNYFELKQNLFRDDRRDVLASTRAALDYLQKLYNMFGDWQLALAAYNWGEGSVSRAIARNQKAGLGISYSELNMPAETRLYVPKLQAVKNIIANPNLYRTDLPLIENHPYFQSVDITRDIDVALAAKLADVKLDDFKALNPSSHRPVILAAGTPQILLPWDNATVFTRNLEAYTQGQYASWTAWTAPSTMSVSAAAQQVGMSEYDLRSVNNIPPRMLIKAGSSLIVPRSALMQDVSEHVADTAHLSLAPEIVNRKTSVKAGKRDTVASIAKKYGVSASNVADWNDIKASAAFKAGQQVVLFLPVKLTGTRAAPPERAGQHSRSTANNKTSGTSKQPVIVKKPRKR
ncbi:MAG: transglycosylase SLT domain-containing protein [Burkholderiales bacterium]|nr:transglycosylase SLT domain-containing protein [Burkholderiales bacterium]